MATYIQGSANCNIPITYKCSKCGARCSSTIPLSGSSKNTYSPLKGSMRDQRDDAEFEALNALASEIEKVYSDTPLKCHRHIVGKCDSCGNTEPWQVSPQKYKLTNFLTTIVAILLGLSCILIPVALGSLPLIPVFFVGLLVLIWVYSIWKQKYPSKKAKNMQALIDSLPEDNKPAFAYSPEEMLKSIGLSSAQANYLINQKNAQEDTKDTKNNTWICSGCGKRNIGTDIMCKDCGEYR